MMKEEKKNNKIGMLILIICMFAVGFVAGRLFQSNNGTNIISVLNTKASVEEEVDFDLFWSVWDQMATKYVDTDKVTAEEMLYGAIKGMVDSYDDPATVFLTPEETDEFNATSEGKYFEGIGAELGYEDGVIIVVSPLEGSPAKEAGIRPGDYILAVDGVELTSDDTVYDAVSMIRGEADTDVVLTILHKGDSESQDITITRSEITVPSMTLDFVGDNEEIAYLNVDRFTDSSYNEWISIWDEKVQEIVASGVDKVILDLRGNPGGFFDAAIYAADDFIGEGHVISQQQDGEGNVQKYYSGKDGNLLNVQLIVLVDEGSASASEILSGALQQSERATVIGQPTYGKGTAQSVVDLNGGSTLHITILKWLLPNGDWINTENSITPNIEVEFGDEDFLEGTDPQLERAIEEITN